MPAPKLGGHLGDSAFSSMGICMGLCQIPMELKAPRTTEQCPPPSWEAAWEIQLCLQLHGDLEWLHADPHRTEGRLDLGGAPVATKLTS